MTGPGRRERLVWVPDGHTETVVDACLIQLSAFERQAGRSKVPLKQALRPQPVEAQRTSLINSEGLLCWMALRGVSAKRVEIISKFDVPMCSR